MNCITVSYGKVYGRAKKFRYWQPAIYEMYVTQNGRKVWKYISHIGVARRSLRLATKDAEDLTNENNYFFLENIRQWKCVVEDQIGN